LKKGGARPAGTKEAFILWSWPPMLVGHGQELKSFASFLQKRSAFLFPFIKANSRAVASDAARIMNTPLASVL
jgi:hypothetical protein